MNRRIYCLAAMVALAVVMAGMVPAAELQPIKLNPPDTKRGLPFMEALSVKASAREFSEKELSLQDLSDLLWAACGVNRPEEKKYTASSAMNARDVDVYVFTKDGAFLYDPDNNELKPVLEGDHRSELMMARPPRPDKAPGDSSAAGAPPPPPQAESNPPVRIVLVSDSDRFRAGTPELKYEWGAIDAGIISQNISLFCAATGLKTRPRASMDKEKIKTLLNLKPTQFVLLEHPVGYAK